MQQFRCDELAQSHVVRQLADDHDSAPLFRLLHIMACDTYSDFVAFVADPYAKQSMDENRLSVEECGDKMRLLTLVSLAHAQKEISYGVVASALRVELLEVESWVMKGIDSGLIAAKMDQVREAVSVSMCAERDFRVPQTERLHVSLVNWHGSMTQVLDLLRNSHLRA